MTDRYDENLILDYLEGDLPPADRQRFEAKLAQDAALRTLVEQLAGDRKLLRSIPEEPAPARIMEQVNERLERSMLLEAPPAEAPFPVTARRLRLGRFVAYSALAALVMLGLGLIIRTLIYSLDIPPAHQSTPPTMAGADAAGDGMARAAKSVDSATPAVAAEGSALALAEDRDASARMDVTRSLDNRGRDRGDSLMQRDQERTGADELFGAPDVYVPPALPATPSPRVSALAFDADGESSAAMSKGGAAPVMGKGWQLADAPGPQAASAPQSAQPGSSLALGRERETSQVMSNAMSPSPLAEGVARIEGPSLEDVQLANVKVQVVAADPTASRRQIVSWAGSNRVQVLDDSFGLLPEAVVEQIEAGDRLAARERMRLESGEEADRAGGAQALAPLPDRKQVMLVLSAEQVPQLMFELNNTDANQWAELVPRPVEMVGEAQRQYYSTMGDGRRFEQGRGQALPQSAPAVPPMREQRQAEAGSRDVLEEALRVEPQRRSQATWNHIVQNQLGVAQQMPAPTQFKFDQESPGQQRQLIVAPPEANRSLSQTGRLVVPLEIVRQAPQRIDTRD